jgi:dihydroorotate dehydrogenase
MKSLYHLVRPLVFCMAPEFAHKATLWSLKLGLVIPFSQTPHTMLRTVLWDRVFPNPVGIAAGFDKNGEVISALFKMGFGFAELGTVTLKPQIGNPKPRIFRCVSSEAVINRMGFPSQGVAKFKENLSAFLGKKPRPVGVIGINIGMNKDQTDPAQDYTALIRTIGPMADYLAINVSSPNTPGLRNLQQKEPLAELLTAVMDERAQSCGDHLPPLLVKLAPDLSDEMLADIAEVLLDKKVDGVILTNTTLARPEDLPESFAGEKGGLSGSPLTDISTAIIRRFYALTKGKIPIIGVGGIMSGLDAYTKIRAGASLVQIYSGLVYEGPELVRSIHRDLVELAKADGFVHISEAVGADHREEAREANQDEKQRYAAHVHA